MARYGIIWVGWQSEDMLNASLSPWVAARAARLEGHDWVVCCVAVPFVGFTQPARLDGTVDALSARLHDGSIDCLVAGVSPAPLTETDARGRALTWLRDTGKVDLVWQVDSDEIYTEAQILAITRFIDHQPYITWFKLCLRNAVFTADQYLTEPFTPARIHRVYPPGWFAHGFWDDNNVSYLGRVIGPVHQETRRDTAFPSLTIPKETAWIKHLTWLSDERSRSKVAYQRARGWECSYRWDETTNQLAFNEAYYAARGLPLPTVARLP